MPNILVTGAHGFVGSHLLRQHAHLPMVAGLRKPEDTSTPSVIIGDITKPFHFPLDFEVSTVIHCAARAHQVHETAPNPLEAFRAVNVKGLEHTFTAALERGLKRFIFLSSIKVMGEKSHTPFKETDAPHPVDAYGRSKLEAETLLKEMAQHYGVEWVIVRPPLVYGPKAGGNIARMLSLIQKGFPLPLASLKNQRSMVHIETLCDFLISCLKPEAANQLFHIADKDYTTAEFIRQLAKDYHLHPKLFPCPAWLLKVAGTMLGKRQEIDRLCDSLQVDCTHARQLLQPK